MCHYNTKGTNLDGRDEQGTQAVKRIRRATASSISHQNPAHKTTQTDATRAREYVDLE
jgi:hypothetical protein